MLEKCSHYLKGTGVIGNDDNMDRPDFKIKCVYVLRTEHWNTVRNETNMGRHHFNYKMCMYVR